MTCRDDTAGPPPVAPAAVAPPPASREPGSPLPHLLADPNLAIFEDRFYLYPTTDGHPDWGATSFRVYTSPDLVNWDDRGTALELGRDVRWARAHAWAPAIARKNGLYYLYFTAESNVGVATATDPAGPFTDVGEPLVPDGRFPGRAIDPSVFCDDDGVHYLYWGNTTANGVRLNQDMVSFDAAQVVSWTPTQFREAAWVHEANGRYYLSWSVDDTRHEDYHVQYASGPTPLGPWEEHGVLLAKLPDRGIRGTGHHSIVQIPGTEIWVIAYHRFAIPGGNGFHREVMFDRLVHRSDGLIERVVPASTPLRLSLPHHTRGVSNVASR
jgi:beta-xylosidase